MSIELNSDLIKENSPIAWNDFLNYYSTQCQNTVLRGTPFVNLPFELQVGMILKYFDENTITLNLPDISLSSLSEAIPEGFENMEHILSHYS